MTIAPSAAARLGEVDLPDFGMPDSAQELADHLFSDRLERLRERASAGGYDYLVVYADRSTTPMTLT